MLAKTYLQNGNLSKLQLASYRLALEDLTPHELEIGIKRVLKTWNFANLLPSPGYIREAVAAELEKEKFFGPSKASLELAAPRLTLEEAWLDWECSEQYLKTMREKFPPEPKPKRKYHAAPAYKTIVVATDARRAELERQKQQILEKYGKK